MGFAAVARVTDDKWVACSVRDEIGFGLQPGGELQLESTICHEIRQHRQPVFFDDATQHPEFSTHHTPRTYGLRSYISVPIVLSDGSFFGTLCAIDPNPAEVSRPHILTMFQLFAEMIGYHLEASTKLAKSNIALLDQQEASALREQFIAVLGHDLRNPLAGIQGGMRLLEKEALSERGNTVVGMVHDAINRMAVLIDNVMDFARGRLGGGIALRFGEADISELLRQVSAEIRSGHPDRVILADIGPGAPAFCDKSRLGQLFSNLLGNAITHGLADQPIHITSRITDGWLEVSVVNGGGPIPPAIMDQLFTPFSRGEVRPGLGLGLYIASQIAEAHGGTLTASSSAGQIIFTFRMPTGKR